MRILKVKKPDISVCPITVIRCGVNPSEIPKDMFEGVSENRKSFQGGIYTDSTLSVYSIPTESVPDSVYKAVHEYGKMLGENEKNLYLVAPPQVSVYAEGSSRSWHIDGGFPDPDDPGKSDIFNHCLFTCVVELSKPTDYEGGHLEFFAYHEKFNTKKPTFGTLRFFPSVIWHKVNPVVKGCRYSLSLFVGVKTPKYKTYAKP